MRAAELTTASVLLLLGGVVIYDAAQLGIGWGGEGPGSGFFPFWLAALLVIFSAVLFVQAWRRPTTRPFATRAQVVPVLKVLIPVVAAVAITVPIAAFVVFEQWFLVPMPKGPLEAWLGY